MDREDNCIAYPQRNNFHPALHAWALFRQNEFPTREIFSRFGEKDRHLHRECKIAIEILMQAIEVASLVLKK